jgi:predicted nucleic acid-binding protein
VTTAVHIDTSFLLRAARPETEAASLMTRWLNEGRSIHMSAMAWAEFQCGPVTDQQRALAARLLSAPVPMHARHADLAARLFNASGRRRGSLQDCLIAAAAIDAEAPLATTDAGFERFAEHGLQIV